MQIGDEAEPAYGSKTGVAQYILSHLLSEGFNGSFARIDSTSDDISVAMNGVHILRLPQTHIGNLPIALTSRDAVLRLSHAAARLSPKKIEALLHYDSKTDYRLPEITPAE